MADNPNQPNQPDPEESVSGSVSASSTISIPATAAAGGLSFTQPPQTASASFYKIAQGQTITFGYTLTSLSVTPTAITFRAWCSMNANTYDITTVAPTATEITWSPYQYEQQPGANKLAVATYVLQAFDERGPQAIPTGGYFSPNTNVRFALYRPQEYVPLESWVCGPDCSGASGLHEVPRNALFAVVFTTLAILLGGLNVLGRGRARRQRAAA